jgi:hypothetical protein
MNDGDLEAALIAKLTSNDLTAIDQFTTQRSNAGQANRLDPLSFARQNNRPLVDPRLAQQQQRMIEEANRTAEQLYPLPAPVLPPVSAPVPERVGHMSNMIMNKESESALLEKLESIAQSLKSVDTTLQNLVTTLELKNA